MRALAVGYGVSLIPGCFGGYLGRVASEERYVIGPVRTPAEIDAARVLFRAYADSLGFDLSYQGFEDELASLPGAYAPPWGEILLARMGEGVPVGCVALRRHDEGVCEMKRLFVCSEARGSGVGRALIRAIVEAGRSAGYREMVLDTVATMEAAVRVYEGEGFVTIPPYLEPTFDGHLFFGKSLREP